MKKIENEEFNVNVDVSGNDEIALLSKSFNKMSYKLNELVSEVYTVRLKQREAELKALQAQINPHFLYNTMDIIFWMCRMENAYESSELINALSKLFRLSLNSGSEFTTVKNEIDHLNCYILIQKKRFEDKITFNTNVTADVLECKVVKLIIQPLVENAIHHGIEKKRGKGKIDITITRNCDDLIYTITDNGMGADEKEINKLLENVQEDNRGFALKNVNDRIKLYFGESYGLEFSSMVGIGTTITVKQPYIIGGLMDDKTIAG